jgi:DNA-binding transcriptional LysR family regulator
METFTRVVETGSFSSAARCLNVGQPAVSKSVALLEERLGVRLLLRSTRGLTPTDAGQTFYERARRVIEQADEADLAARGSGSSLSGPLRVSVAVTLAQLHIFPRLKDFVDAHPELTLDLVMDDRHIDLLEEGIDVALRIGALDDSGMTASKIGSGRRVVVGTPSYFAAAGEPATPADLMRHEAVVLALAAGERAWSFRRDGEAPATVAVGGRLRVTAVEGVRAAVLAGIGLAVSPEWVFASELASGAVREVLPEWQLPPVDLWAVYPSGRMVSARARAFVAFVKAAIDTPHVLQ